MTSLTSITWRAWDTKKAEPMKITLTHSDITSELCLRCGACCCGANCTVRMTVNADPRFRRFLRTRGLDIEPPVKEDEKDCCDKTHDIEVAIPPCPHCEILEEKGETIYRCMIYESEDHPDYCADYNCVSWAKYSQVYNDKNELLVKAQTVLNKLRENGGKGA